MTALEAAAAAGRDDVARLLVERGADVNARDAKGMTASQWALDQGHVELARTLRAAEVRPPTGPANPLPAPEPARSPGPPTPVPSQPATQPVPGS
jgi:ankyrin repeat protein